jgi:glycosyltransferase involved in cell wall biosynthesis
LGIPDTRKILLFVAQSSENPLKGFGHLTEALRKIDIEDVTLVSVGRNEPEVPANSSHVHVGYIDDDSMLSTIYSMADVFVIPSLQEAFGQTALESMACGTPVVGFNAGGIPDMVRPNETGWLAETGNVRSLRKAIERALMQDGKRHRMSKRCREVVEEEYTLKKQANQYLLLYRSILEQNTDRCE